MSMPGRNLVRQRKAYCFYLRERNRQIFNTGDIKVQNAHAACIIAPMGALYHRVWVRLFLIIPVTAFGDACSR